MKSRVTNQTETRMEWKQARDTGKFSGKPACCMQWPFIGLWAGLYQDTGLRQTPNNKNMAYLLG